MNITRLVAVIEANPGIRTVQLCDRLDEEIDAVEDALRLALKASSIQEHDVIGPNGRKAKAFTVAGVELPTAEGASAKPVLEPARPKTKIEQAVEFIQSQPDNQATGSQLHIVLKLRPNESPSQYLQSALKDGRLVKDGKVWRIGPGKAATAAQVEQSSPSKATTEKPVLAPAVEAVSKRVFPVEEILRTVARDTSANIAAQVASVQQPAPAAPPSFRCAVWSDDSLVLERDGNPVAELSRGELAQLRDYLNRLAA